MSDKMSFESALCHLKDGKRVARSGWNGKGMWLALVRPLRGEVVLGYHMSVGPHSPRWADELDTSTLLPWIGMKTADNKFVPWLASQTDILAEDWEVVYG